MSAPHWAKALLRLCVPTHRLEDVLGDLDEMHARRRRSSSRLRAWLVTSAEALAVAAAFGVSGWKDRATRSVWLTWPEVKLAARMARKQPLLNLAALLALATGITLSAAAFTLMRATLHGRVPFPDGDRFVRINAVTEPGGARASLERERFELLRGEDVFAYLGAGLDAPANLLDDGDVEAVRGVALTADAFRVLPYQPLVGRTLVAADDAPGASPVVLISQGLWERRFGEDPDVVGRVINVGGTSREIVGVLPGDAGFPNKPDIWTPLHLDALPSVGGERSNATVVFGVLRKGTTLEAAEERVAARSAGFEADRSDADRLRVLVVPFAQVPQRGMIQVFLTALLTAILAVLVVIASNVGNLVSARTAARRGELAVRSALGAPRARLVAQLFAEVALLCGASAVLAAWGLQEMMARLSVWMDGDIPFWFSLMPNAATWAFVGGVTLLACLVAGGIPALRATRGAPAQGLHSTGRGSGTAVFGRAASAMGVMQIAFSVALLGATILALRGMVLYANQPTRVPADRILTAGFSTVRSQAADTRMLLSRIEEAAAELPGVRSVGFGSAVPGVESRPRTVEVEALEGEPPIAARTAPILEARPGYLETLGASATLGRLLEPADLTDGAAPVAVVNESFVRKFLHGRNPVGRRVRFLAARQPGEVDDPAPPEWREIVGVVPDLGMSVGDPEMEGGLYVPLETPSWGYLILDVSGDPNALIGPLRQALVGVDSDILAPLVRPLSEAGSQNAEALGLFGGLMGALGGMALLLSLVSTYALVSFTVSRRVREVGIRVALGASRTAVLRSVAGRAALQVGLGAVLGAPLCLLLLQTRMMFVFRVPSGEPWLLPLVALLIVGAGVLASWIPARRALGVGPAEALRSE